MWEVSIKPHQFVANLRWTTKVHWYKDRCGRFRIIITANVKVWSFCCVLVGCDHFLTALLFGSSCMFPSHNNLGPGQFVGELVIQRRIAVLAMAPQIFNVADSQRPVHRALRDGYSDPLSARIGREDHPITFGIGVPMVQFCCR